MSEKTEQGAVEEKKSFGEVLSSFFSEVSAEFHRITWPRGRQLIDSTVVVLVLIVLLSAVVFAFDGVIKIVLEWILGK